MSTRSRILWGLTFFAPVVLAIRALIRPGLMGDSLALIEGARKLQACAAAGQWSGCPGSEGFPILQDIPTWIAFALGDPDPVKIFVWLSVAAFAWIAILGFRDFTQDHAHRAPSRPETRQLRSIYLLSLFGGYGVCYIGSSFGEMLAAGLIFLAVRVFYLSGRSPWLRAALLALACITKDTAPLFVGLAALSTSSLQGMHRDVRKTWIPLILGSAAGAAINTGFNLWRFGSPINLHYLRPDFLVQSTSLQLNFTAAQWLSPAGGIAFFWPAVFGLILWAIGQTRTEAPSPRALGTWGLALLLLGLTLGFGRWYCPLGWSAWGHRLLLPWLPATLWLLLMGYRNSVLSSWNGLSSIHKKVLITVGALLALPHYSVLASGPVSSLILQAHWTPSDCSPGHPSCQLAQLWPLGPGIFGAYAAPLNWQAFAAAAACAFAWWRVAMRTLAR